MTFECLNFGYRFRVSAASSSEAVSLLERAGVPNPQVVRARGGLVLRDLQELRQQISAARRRIQSTVR